jgi:hypothetical protein
VSRAARFALRTYPPSFRARYGAELAALVEDLPASRRAAVDLFVGAGRAWIRPTLAGDGAYRLRLQSSAATIWVAWCTGFLVVPAMTKALLDPPPHGPVAGVRDLLAAGTVLLVVGWLCALAGALPLVLKSIVPSWRARRWSALRPLLPALLLGLAEAAATITWVVISGGHAEQFAHPSRPYFPAVIPLLVGGAAFIAALGIGPAMTLRRLDVTPAQLKVSAMLAIPVAIALAGLTACCLIAAVTSAAPGAQLIGSNIPVALVLAAAVVSSVVGLISSTRGLRALRAI